jgi:hypothetical protein
MDIQGVSSHIKHMDTIDRDKITASKPAAKTGEEEKKVPRAKPVKGEVDWAELSREHIARYPKIRARLAE